MNEKIVEQGRLAELTGKILEIVEKEIETKFLLSVVILFYEQDSGFVEDCIRTLPNYAEIILMKTIQIETPKLEPYDIKVNDEGNIIMMVQEYKDLNLADLRNVAKSYAHGEWIFSLDPDERLCVHQHADLKKILEDAPANCGGLLNVNVGWYNGEIDSNTRLPQWHLVHQVRIFRNKKEFNWRSMIHEDIQKCITDHEYTIMGTETIIHHLGYKRTPEQLQAKLIRNIKCLIKEPLTLTDEKYFNYLIRECVSVAALRKDKENES